MADSTPVPPHEPKPPAGAPNVVAIVLDDTGFAQLGCFGSDIATPHMDRLADGGLRYNRFHVTSLCSPTRASFFTGRNHHAVGMGFLADIPLGFPGYTARLPKTRRRPSPRPARRRVQHHGRRQVAPDPTLPAVGRRPVRHAGRSGSGFERYYGFLQGDANHWAPNLVRDNHYVDPPAGPRTATT